MDRRISQRQLAKHLRVSKSSIESWEGNQAAPARWMVPRIRTFLGLQPSGPPASFAERLTAYRRGLGLSQEALARMIGVHLATVVRWERGRRRPSKRLRAEVEAILHNLND